MSAAYQNLYLEQGASFSTTITMTDVFGNAYNLQSFGANSQIRRSYNSANASGYFSCSINTSTGQLTLAMDANTSATLAAGRYVYDAKIIDSAHGTKVRVLEGILDVSPQVSIA